jgi:enoyl-CoA hydratase/carnithine racemase
MQYNTILSDVEDGVNTITLNRPERLNAWTYEMGEELHHALHEANESEAVTAMVITGAGRGFCAGADIKDLFLAQAKSTDNAGSGENRSPRDWVGLVRRSKPIVAAVNGAAIGVGLTQILPCDMIIASPAAQFSVRFIKMGLVPELASSYYLIARTGFGRGNELMLTGGTISAEQALEYRLIDRLVDEPDTLLQTAQSVARSMGENPPSALRMVKELVTANMAEPDIKKVQQREGIALAECYKSPEHHEAIDAFLEKRPPDFKKARQPHR